MKLSADTNGGTNMAAAQRRREKVRHGSAGRAIDLVRTPLDYPALAYFFTIGLYPSAINRARMASASFTSA